VAFVGAGNYAAAVLIPAFKAAGVRFKVVASSGGVSGVHAGRKFGFEETTTDTNSVFADPQVNTVVICTRHDSHARLVCQALGAGKHVFVEKPLALTLHELADIAQAYGELGPPNPAFPREGAGRPLLMVGFNRRFAPQVRKIQSLLEGVKGPKAFVMTVNSGAIPADHWTQDPAVGGGRIVGEACHFIDLLRFLAGVSITYHSGTRMEAATADTVTIQLGFADGSIGTIHYFANGNKSFPKERLEVFCAGRILQLDNFRKLTGYRWPGFKRMSLWRQDKGNDACVQRFVDAVRDCSASPIPANELLEVARTSLDIADRLVIPPRQ
jgi:predicted dehydrogenase